MTPVELAIECTKAVEAAVNKLTGDEERRRLKEAYAQRARRFATDVYILGPAYVAAVAAARSSKDAVEPALSAENCQKAVDEALGRVAGDGKASREEASYALYGAVLLYALKRLGALSAQDFAEALRQLEDPAASLAAGQAAEWVKRLAEAYFKPPEGGE